MTNPIYFSNFLIPAAKKATFLLVVVTRFFRGLFKFDRRLILLELDYQKKYQFDKSFLVIRYRFKNALWYCFKGIKTTTDAGTIILNPERIPNMSIALTVYGFCCKKVISINITPELALQTAYFRAAISQPKDLRISNRPFGVRSIVFEPVVAERRLHLSPVSMRLSSVKVSQTSIQIKYPLFNQTELL